MSRTAVDLPARRASSRLVPGPVELRRRLERMGPIFVKIGQYLALRPDLIPQEYCDELTLLFDRVTPVPWEEIRRVLRDDFGREPESLFATIDPRPFAAGSLAQAHRARLADGAEVVVKVRRPGIEARVAVDLRRARRIARLLELGRVRLIGSPRELVAEIEQWLAMELDFERELANLRRLRALTEDRSARVPRAYPHLSSPRVVTLEYLAGIQVSELLRAGAAGTPGMDRDRFAANLLRASLRQIFRYHFFHADLHPGNLIVLAKDAVGFVDFGLCVELDPATTARQSRYVSALYGGDDERIFRSLLEILRPSRETNLEALRRDFFTLPPPVRGAGAKRSPIAQRMVEILRLCRIHRMRVPTHLLAMYRALLMAETVAHLLGSRASLKTVGRRFFEELQTEELLDGLRPESLRAQAVDLARLVRDSPALLTELFEDLAGDRFQLPVRVSETPEAERARNRRTRLLTTAVLSVGVAMLLARPDLPSVWGISVAWPLLGGLLFLYARAFALWRRLDR